MKGLIHIYHGNGKGKTTCGIGLCCRAAGAGMRVLVYQFMKDGEGNERKSLEQLENVTFASEKRHVRFSFQMDENEIKAERERYMREFNKVTDMICKGRYDVLFLDEVLYAIKAGLMDENSLIEYLDHKPESLEVILTGRDPSDKVRKRADYISEIRKEKHPYDNGIQARNGIER